ncbi:MAG TPA: hypothetical protein VMU26_16250 [Candidatus Polarisedimenticolia bacterium]|nr:hypothetical protein [Candidatus Polarisedimenticolia bacterium]
MHLPRSYGDGFILLPARADGKKMRVPEVGRIVEANTRFNREPLANVVQPAAFKSKALTHGKINWFAGAGVSTGATAPICCRCATVNKAALTSFWAAGVGWLSCIRLSLSIALFGPVTPNRRPNEPLVVPGMGWLFSPVPVTSVCE